MEFELKSKLKTEATA